MEHIEGQTSQRIDEQMKGERMDGQKNLFE